MLENVPASQVPLGVFQQVPNVDFNPEMRTALTKVCDDESTGFELTSGGFSVSSPEIGTAFERKVELPVRWVKGFQEVQASQARMKSHFQLLGPAVQRFIRSIPRQTSHGPVWLVPQSNTFRLSQSPIQGALMACGLERLKFLSQIAQHATRLEAYGSGDGSSAWRIDTQDSRFFLVLSPELSRGFSGEGQTLSHLAAQSNAVAKLRALLRWSRTIDVAKIASQLSASVDTTAAVLAQAAASGLVGYDLASSSYFHRELPFRLTNSEALNPRLAQARRIAQSGQFEFDAEGVWLRSKDTEYRLVQSKEGTWSCTCPWVSRYGLSRGPCKHILAVQIVSDSKAIADAHE